MFRHAPYKDIDTSARIGQAILLITLLGLGAAGLIYGIHSQRKEKRVNQQVEEYEKTLPGYLEQKQMVEHYRDSLMNAK